MQSVREWLQDPTTVVSDQLMSSFAISRSFLFMSPFWNDFVLLFYVVFKFLFLFSYFVKIHFMEGLKYSIWEWLWKERVRFVLRILLTTFYNLFATRITWRTTLQLVVKCWRTNRTNLLFSGVQTISILPDIFRNFSHPPPPPLTVEKKKRHGCQNTRFFIGSWINAIYFEF